MNILFRLYCNTNACHPRESGDPAFGATVKEVLDSRWSLSPREKDLDSRFRGNDIGNGNDSVVVM